MGRDRRWLARAEPPADAGPLWARRMYRRSLLVLRASVDPHSGAAVAGAPLGWAYVWPRDAGAVAIALASAGYREEARRIARFLLDLDLGAAARFDRDGESVDGRAAQGDAAGWVAAAARAAGIPAVAAGRRSAGLLLAPTGQPAAFDLPRAAWRGRADYQEKDGGDFLGNAIASVFVGELAGRGAADRRERRLVRAFETSRGLVRSAGDPESGLDTAAAWAVRPFPRPALFPAVRRTLLRLVAERESRFGLLPAEDWDGGDDPWTAPTAWAAWALAALANECGDEACRAVARKDRRAALGLMGDLRRAATPLGLLPERVDARIGRPTSTTPLAWSHAFAILAIRELWPPRR
jgi:glucoamylase